MPARRRIGVGDDFDRGLRLVGRGRHRQKGEAHSGSDKLWLKAHRSAQAVAALEGNHQFGGGPRLDSHLRRQRQLQWRLSHHQHDRCGCHRHLDLLGGAGRCSIGRHLLPAPPLLLHRLGLGRRFAEGFFGGSFSCHAGGDELLAVGRCTSRLLRCQLRFGEQFFSRSHCHTRCLDLLSALLCHPPDPLGIGLGQFGRLRIAGVPALRHPPQHDLVGAGRQLGIEFDRCGGAGGRLLDLHLWHLQFGRQVGGGEREPAGRLGLTHNIQRHAQLASPSRLPDAGFMGGDGKGRRVGSDRQREGVQFAELGVLHFGIGIPPQHGDAGSLHHFLPPDRGAAHNADRAGPGLAARGCCQAQQRPIRPCCCHRWRRADAGREPLGGERDIAGKTVRLEHQNIDPHRATDRQHRGGDESAFRVGAMRLGQHSEQVERGAGSAHLHHIDMLRAGMRFPLEIAHQHAVAAIGRRLEFQQRIGRGPIENASLEFARPVVGVGDFLDRRPAVGLRRDLLDQERGIGRQPQPSGEHLKHKPLARLGCKAKPVAVALGKKPADNAAGEGHGLWLERIIIVVLFHHDTLGGNEHRQRRLGHARDVDLQVGQLTGGIAWGVEAPVGACCSDALRRGQPQRHQRLLKPLDIRR